MVIDESTLGALAELTVGGLSLRGRHRFPWPPPVEQAALRLRLDAAFPSMPSLVGLVGGASSGKSTVFNNLLAGRTASRVAARGHSTRGPILAAHELHRVTVERAIGLGALMPGYSTELIEPDANIAGEPGKLAVLFHTLDDLRDVLLFDLPDFTSDAARTEGDATRALWPWFDRLIVVVDHERWFDLQSMSTIRSECGRFAQPRWVLFNRTREGELNATDRAVLLEQAARLGAEGHTFLDFRHGRGLCLFPPGTFEATLAFARRPRQNRQAAVFKVVADASRQVLNQNAERSARRDALRESVRAAAARLTPTVQTCLTSLMTPRERAQLDVISRVLRLDTTRDWMRQQVRRVSDALRSVPLLGGLAGAASAAQGSTGDRAVLGLNHFDAVAHRMIHEIGRIVSNSAFWEEVRGWTGAEPTAMTFATLEGDRALAMADVRELDEAVARWTAKVESECQGLAPHLKGAIGVGAVGLAIVLIALPGPVTAVTLVAAKGAVGAALSQLLTAAGVGAALGRHFSRLTSVAQEKLIGCPEYDAVHRAATNYQGRLESAGQRISDHALAQSDALLLAPDDPVGMALGTISDAWERQQ